MTTSSEHIVKYIINIVTLKLKNEFLVKTENVINLKNCPNDLSCLTLLFDKVATNS